MSTGSAGGTTAAQIYDDVFRARLTLAQAPSSALPSTSWHASLQPCARSQPPNTIPAHAATENHAHIQIVKTSWKSTTWFSALHSYGKYRTKYTVPLQLYWPAVWHQTFHHPYAAIQTAPCKAVAHGDAVSRLVALAMCCQLPLLCSTLVSSALTASVCGEAVLPQANSSAGHLLPKL